MKRRKRASPGAAAAVALAVLAAAMALPAGAQQAAAWEVELLGARSVRLDAAAAERLIGASRVEGSFAVTGGDRLYSGFPLGALVALVDDATDATGRTFDGARWSQGYDITVTARDGYAATLSTRDFRPEAVLLADRENGNAIAPGIVGHIDRGLWVRDVATVEIAGLRATAADAVSAATAGGGQGGAPPADFRLVLDLNGTEHRFGLADLAASDLYVEAPGSYTTSAGSRSAGRYGGVRLAALIERYVTLGPDESVEFVAMDGYRMAYPASELKATTGGEWILAFRLDGAWLPRDPGYLRTIRVGPETPGTEGHLSVKMVERVVVRQAGYRPFELVVDGLMSARLDRQTVQSCLNCHGLTVRYERKGQAASYRGVALWRFLAYGDDAERAPHRAPSEVISYDAAAAKSGYGVEVIAADGFVNALDSRALDGNDGIVLALAKEGAELPDDEWPLVLVWDTAAVVPESIKPVKGVVRLSLGLRPR